jgi:hypothetical protein
MALPKISLSEFRKQVHDLNAEELKAVKSYAVESDSELVGFFIVPQTDFIKLQVEFTAETGNAIGGKEFGDLPTVKETAKKQEAKHAGSSRAH